MPFELLARELGFSHVRSFRHAYKRWTGRTPARFRSLARDAEGGSAPPPGR
jgi:AraC-like DNA-binding protein